jgi:hypothetical protein
MWSLAVGGGLGNLGGGLLYDLGRAWGAPELPWLAFCAVGLVSAAGLGLLHRRLRGRAAPVDAGPGREDDRGGTTPAAGVAAQAAGSSRPSRTRPSDDG